jgi:hypothetical protein
MPTLSHPPAVAAVRMTMLWRSRYDPDLGRLVQHARLLAPIGYVPPAEYETRYYEQAAVV